VLCVLVMYEALAAMHYPLRDADSTLYEAIALALKDVPFSRWVAPLWPAGRSKEGLFLEHLPFFFWPAALLYRVGVAQAALEQARAYASQRVQFGEPIGHFPRVADKIVMMAAEIVIARQLTYYAARQKDSGRRCDLEAGMAKLLAARVAWAAADNAVQIHGGNGFAVEFPISRILCDARILNIFEGAAEIQAQVIARRLLDGSN